MSQPATRTASMPRLYLSHLRFHGAAVDLALASEVFPGTTAGGGQPIRREELVELLKQGERVVTVCFEPDGWHARDEVHLSWSGGSFVLHRAGRRPSNSDDLGDLPRF